MMQTLVDDLHKVLVVDFALLFLRHRDEVLICNLNNKIVKLQKMAVRIITSSNYLAHNEPIFEKLPLTA